MGLKVKGERVYLVLRPVEERTTPGGIVLPDMHSEGTRIGIVKEVGEKVDMYKPGDQVVISYYTGIVIKLFELGSLDRDIHRVCSQEEIIGTWEDEKCQT